MNYLRETLEYLSKLFQWWVIVEPWEAGLRVRFGKHIKVMSAGTFFRIPFFDAVYIQEVRMRMYSMNPQTVTSKDGHTITIVASVGYSISDILTLYESISQPDSTIGNTVLGTISDYVTKNTIQDCGPTKIEQEVSNKLSELSYGIKFEQVRITGYAIVKTYRLIQDGSYVNDGVQLTVKR